MVQPEAKLRSCRKHEALSFLKNFGFVGDRMVLQFVAVEFSGILSIAKRGWICE